MYELRDSSWFDRGTGYCKGIYDDTQDLALLIVEAEDTGPEKGVEEGEGGFLKEELLLTARVEKDDIYVRQQGESSTSLVTRRHCRILDIWAKDPIAHDRYIDCLDRAIHNTRHSSFFPGCGGM